MDHIRLGIRQAVGEERWVRLRFVWRRFLPWYLPRMLHFQLARMCCCSPKHPDELFIFVTNRCNARCKHCFYIDELGDTSAEMTTEEWIELGRSLPRLEHLTLTGGEALLHPDLPAIAEGLCRSARPKVLTVISNGLRPDALEQFVEQWLETADREFGDQAPMLDILISLDGLEAIHDEIRGVAGAWKNANESIRRMARLRDELPGQVDIGVVTVITERNWQEIEPLANHVRDKLCVRQGFEFVRGTSTSVWGLSHDSSSGFNPQGVGLPPQEHLNEIVETLRRLNRSAGKNTNYEFFVTNVLAAQMLQGDRSAALPCVAAGQTTAVIYPDGGLAACEFMKPFGNLKTDFRLDFQKAWKSPKLASCRKVATKCVCTHGCYLSRAIALTPRGLMKIWREL